MRYFEALELRSKWEGKTEAFRFVGSNITDSICFSDFYAAIQNVADFLNALGVRRQSVVLIFAQHGRAVLECFFGVQMIGAIPCFMPPPTSRQDVSSWKRQHIDLLAHITPSLVVAADDCFEVVQAIAGDLTIRLSVLPQDGTRRDLSRIHEAGPDDIAVLQHSSGTTGLKKGVTITYRQLEAQLTAYCSALQLDDRTPIVSWLPIYHDMGLVACTLLPIYLALPVHWIETFSWLANPQLFIDALSANPGAVAWMPNFAFAYMVRRCDLPNDLKALEKVGAIINCSEPCKARDMDAFWQKFRQAGLPEGAVQVCYAMAENVFAVTQTVLGTPPKRINVAADELFANGEIRLISDGSLEPFLTLVSCGQAIDGVQVRLRNTLQETSVGEIEISGASLTAGYYRRDDITQTNYHDGWYTTGDFGFLHEGQLFVTGRSDDVIIVRGKNLYAHDIEAIVNATGETKAGRSVAFGIDNPNSGTRELIVVAERSEATNESSSETIIESIAAMFLVSLTEVVIVDHDVLIKTTSGKLSRTENALRYSAGLLTSWRNANE